MRGKERASIPLSLRLWRFHQMFHWKRAVTLGLLVALVAFASFGGGIGWLCSCMR
jgi:hypothetical protein